MRLSYSPYPAYKPSGLAWLGDIPAHWEVKTLKTALLKNDGGVWGDDIQNDEAGIIVLRSTDIGLLGEWTIINPARRKLSLLELSSSKLLEGDLLVTKSSGSTLHLGKTAIVTKEVELLECCYSNFMQRLRAKPQYSPKFIFWIMNSGVGRNQLNYLGSTTTGLNNLTAKLIGNITISAPPLAEQQAIAAYLDGETARLDALADRYRRLLSLLEEKRRALITHAVTRGLNPVAPLKDSGIEWLGQIPAHWEVKRVKHLAWFNYGESLSFGVREIGDVPVYGSNGQVGTHSIANTHGPCLIIGRKGSFGKVNYSSAGCFAIDTTYYIDDTTTKCDIRWLFYCLSIIGMDKYSQDTGVPGLSRELAHNFWLPNLSLSEQQAIAEYLDRETARLDDLKAKIETLLARLGEHRAALISAAVTGKMDVRDAML